MFGMLSDVNKAVVVVRCAALKVWDLDYLKKGEFMGEVRLSMQDLAEQVPVDGAHEFTAALQPKPGGTDKFNRLVQGSLRFTCQVSRRRLKRNLSRCEQAYRTRTHLMISPR